MIDYICFYCGRFIDGLMGKVYKHGDDAVCDDCEKKYHEGAKNTEQLLQPAIASCVRSGGSSPPRGLGGYYV